MLRRRSFIQADGIQWEFEYSISLQKKTAEARFIASLECLAEECREEYERIKERAKERQTIREEVERAGGNTIMGRIRVYN